MPYKNKQCEAYTKSGAQCQSGAMPNEDYCGPHLTKHGKKEELGEPIQEKEEAETVQAPVNLLRDCWKKMMEHDEVEMAQIIEYFMNGQNN